MCDSLSSACKAAVAILREFEDTQILAWINLLRSLKPDYGLDPSQETLSSAQLDALSILKQYPHNTVIAWLENIRQGSPHDYARS